MEIPSIFDLAPDDEGTLRMPFYPLNWGSKDANATEFPCYECGRLYPRGMMKALGSSPEDPKAFRVELWWDYAIFFCWNCWQTSEYSDASNWVA